MLKLLESRPAKALRDSVATLKAAAWTTGVSLAALTAAWMSLDEIVVKLSLAQLVIALLGTAAIAVVIAIMAGSRVGNADFENLEVYARLRVQPREGFHSYTYERRMKVKSRRDGARLIRLSNHYTATGSKPFDIECLDRSHVLLDPGAAEDDRQHYRWIYLGGPVRRGSIVETGYKEEYTDDIQKLTPYLSVGSVGYRTRKITITIEFDPTEDHSLKETIAAVAWDRRRWRSDRRVKDIPFSRTADVTNGVIQYAIIIDRPRRRYSYGYIWKWPKAVKSMHGR